MTLKKSPYGISLFFVIAADAANADISLVPTSNFEAVRARVTDATPENFTINLAFPRNLSVDRNAPHIALFDLRSPPALCADFRDSDINGERISETVRRYDLSDEPELLEAIGDYRCVVVPNNQP